MDRGSVHAEAASDLTQIFFDTDGTDRDRVAS
jgi:hypothetical protein